MEELSFPSSPNASAPGGGGNGNGADEASQQQPQQQFPMPQQQQENNNFFNAMPHHQYFQQPYPQHFNHQMHYPSRFVHHQHHHHPFGMQTRGQFSPRARVGDWMCPNNCGLVFSSKTNCFRCGVLKPPGSVRFVFLSSLSLSRIGFFLLSSLLFVFYIRFFFLFFFLYGKCRRSIMGTSIERKALSLTLSFFLSFFPLW
jgi:hypothetical protein